MTVAERRAFANLVLLCTPCHKLVDKTHPADYSIERLEAWKQARESSNGPALAAIGTLDEAELAELVAAGVRAALGNPAITVTEARGYLSVAWPGQAVSRQLPLEPATVPVGATVSPTRLVRARSGVVPFSVHQDVRASLLDWCLDGVDFSARVVGGGAGSGKTRLAVQLCEDLAPFGWVRGLLTPSRHQAESEALLATPTPRLVVIDYAEARADQLTTLVPALAARATAEHPVRVLLLVRARRGTDWTALLRGGSEALDALVDDMELDVLADLPLVGGSRRELFAAAAREFASRVAGATAPGAPDSLESPTFATPLLVVIRAYLAVHGSIAVHGSTEGPRSRSELLDELLGHEDRYWRKNGPGAPEDPVLRRRVVALATLAGARDEADAAERLRLVPDLARADDERLRALARWANGLYRGRHQWWNPLEPDLVAEHLVSTTYHGHPEVLAGVLVDRPDVVTRPIGLYARAVPDHPQLAAAVQPVLSGELRRLCQLAIDQSTMETDRAVILGDTTVAAVLARWAAVTVADTGALSDAVGMFPRRSDLVLSPLAVVLTGQLVERMRPLAAANPAACEPDLAGSLNALSNRLGEVGRRDEGLAASEEAVAMHRRLAAANPAAYEPDLASSLNNLSVRLGEVGRRDEGLAAIEEAVAVRRRLAAANPAAYEPALARSLNNLSNHLGEAGRRKDAEQARAEALDVEVCITRRQAGTSSKSA
ncbi:MAG: tetratricopeptide repeat protein [Acidimicrobiales bacterium]